MLVIAGILVHAAGILEFGHMLACCFEASVQFACGGGAIIFSLGECGLEE